MYNSFELALLIILVYLCVWGIINRICRCIETTAIAKAYGGYLSTDVNVKAETFGEHIRKVVDDITKSKQERKDAKENQNNN